MNYCRVWISHNSFKGIIKNSQIQSFGVFWVVCMCVHVFPCSCPSLHVITRQLEAWPHRPRRSPACESMGTLRGEKLAVALQEYGSTPSDAHIHTLRGFTSPWPKQQSTLNFDLSHYLPRRWGDNLWTLASNPGAWVVCVHLYVRHRRDRTRGFWGKRCGHILNIVLSVWMKSYRLF